MVSELDLTKEDSEIDTQDGIIDISESFDERTGRISYLITARSNKMPKLTLGGCKITQ